MDDLELTDVQPTVFEYETKRWRELERVIWTYICDNRDEEDLKVYQRLLKLLVAEQWQKAYTHIKHADTAVREGVPEPVFHLLNILNPEVYEN